MELVLDVFFFLGVVERVLKRGTGEWEYTVHLIGKVGNQLINVYPPPSCIVHSDCVVLCSGAQNRTGHGQGSRVDLYQAQHSHRHAQTASRR